MSKTETQSEALRLAEMLEKGPRRQGDVRIAAVLRGLDAENKALRARLEIDPSHHIDGIEARDETIRQLEAQMRALLGEVEGYALVPTTPTGAMVSAYRREGCAVLAMPGWRAMLAAAKTGDAA